MPTISLAIQKGGSGKTTTAINLAAALKRRGYTVLLADLDPQANLTQALGIVEEPEINIYHLLKNEADGQEAAIRDVITMTECGLELIPSALELANAEMELVNKFAREQLFKDLLEEVVGDYDFIFIDCPPSIATLTANALVASDFVLMPLQAEFLPLRGVRSFIRAMAPIKNKLNKGLDILGFVLTKYDRRKVMNRSVLDQLKEEFGDKVFQTRIRSNISLAQAQEKGVDIFSYDARSNGAKDYEQLADEFLLKLGYPKKKKAKSKVESL